MSKIAVLIDFTEGCKIAVEQAVVLAKQCNAELFSVNIVAEGKESDTRQAELEKFTAEVVKDRVKFQAIVGHGDLMHATSYVLSHIDPKLVVIGTHGIRGIKQHLFGAHILKLVQSILYPCIVVQENTKVNPDGFSKILFPVGPHKKYYVKIEQTAMVAALNNSEVVIYEIERPHMDPEERVSRNKKLAIDFFEEKGTNYSRVLEDTTVISVGYSRQTLQYADKNQPDLISVMSDVPAEEIYFGRADKENILTNPAGIPVLCCNN